VRGVEPGPVIPPFSPAVVWAAGEGPVVLTCEHASNRLPPWLSWPIEDRWIIGTHWAWDLGIAEVTLQLAERLGWTAVLAGFSRLVADPNRAPHEETWARLRAHGRDIGLNRDLSAEERARRLAIWEGYHARVASVAAAQPGHTILSMHSFTPHYEDQEPREVEVGVLFDRHEAEAHALAAALKDEGLRVALNEPYSGKDGLMYSVERAAAPGGRAALELEVRQDLADDPFVRRRLVPAIERAMKGAFSV
jgi:predicted N-formylglutamate amidohydrolase